MMKTLNEYLINRNTKSDIPIIDDLIKKIDAADYPYLYKLYGRDLKKRLQSKSFVDIIKSHIQWWNRDTNNKYQDIADCAAYCAIIWILGAVEKIYEESWNGYDWEGDPDREAINLLDEMDECEFLSGDMDQLISYADNQDLLNSIDKSDLEDLTAYVAGPIKRFIINYI